MKPLIILASVGALLVGMYKLLAPPTPSSADLPFGEVSFSQSCEYRSYPIRPPQNLPPPPRIPPDGIALYRNESYRFSLFYPSGLKVTETAEAGGAHTIVFQNTSTHDGFQIFIVPYRNPGIVPRRMEKDILGTVSDVSTSTVAGICARSFKTHDPATDDTNEVWIPRDGNLFEVTAYSGQEELLEEVISSWRFL